jgi:hypothetical protein
MKKVLSFLSVALVVGAAVYAIKKTKKVAAY